VATGALALLVLLRQPGRHSIACVVVVLLAVAAPVSARLNGLAEALAILGLIAGYDAAAYVVGTGAVNHWEGPAAGVATVGAGSLAVAALAVPPFSLATAFLCAFIIAMAGPLGPIVVRRLTPFLAPETDDGENEAGAPEEAPAVRRLMTLFAAGPALVALTAVIRL